MDQELKAYLDALQENLAGQIRESREHADHLHAQAVEHADHLHTQARVLIENVDKKVGLVWEGVQAINESLGTRLDDHEERIQHLERKVL